MTDEEMMEFERRAGPVQASAWAAIRELAQQVRETSYEVKKFTDNSSKNKTELDRRMMETDRQMMETDRRMKETDRQMKETDRQMKETSLEIKEMNKHLGGLGDKFGSFTEGLAFPSMTHILESQFHMEHIATRVRAKRPDGSRREFDVLAYANGAVNKVVAVEVKSHLRDDGVEQILNMLAEFPSLFPEHRGKTVEAILAFVDASEEVVRKVLALGIHTAKISGDVFEIADPAGFQPRDFSHAA